MPCTHCLVITKTAEAAPPGGRVMHVWLPPCHWEPRVRVKNKVKKKSQNLEAKTVIMIFFNIMTNNEDERKKKVKQKKKMNRRKMMKEQEGVAVIFTVTVAVILSNK